MTDFLAQADRVLGASDLAPTTLDVLAEVEETNLGPGSPPSWTRDLALVNGVDGLGVDTLSGG